MAWSARTIQVTWTDAAGIVTVPAEAEAVDFELEPTLLGHPVVTFDAAPEPELTGAAASFRDRFMACLAEIGEDKGVEIQQGDWGRNTLNIVLRPWTEHKLAAAVRALRLSALDFEPAQRLLARCAEVEMAEAITAGEISTRGLRRS